MLGKKIARKEKRIESPEPTKDNIIRDSRIFWKTSALGPATSAIPFRCVRIGDVMLVPRTEKLVGMEEPAPARAVSH